MTAAAAWAHLPLVKALGWALAHFVWQAALIALLLAAALRVLRSARARYGAACGAMLAMLAAFAITLALSVPDQRTAAPPESARSAAADPGAGNGVTGSAPGLLERVERILPWVVPFWMAGALLMGMYRMAGWLAAERMRRTGVCCAPPRWQQRLGQLARRIGVWKPLVLLESSLAEVPVVIGFLRPAILVPAGLLAGMPAEQVEAILLHELAHIRRADYLVNLAQTLVESLLFYHPAVWWISGLIRAERENCCDDAVVAVQGDAHGYAAALVRLEERRTVGREPALAATGGKLMIRIRRLLQQPDEPRGGAALLLSLGLLAGALCLFAAPPQTDRTGGKATPYTKWLNEDVVYIIAPPERAAFLLLRTDAERDMFIKQFWLRRDPTPGTEKNEFQEEHYRRVAFANTHFASSVPGWKTDRGRVYIVYGPPDEIESHPGLGLEQWLYHHLNGLGNDILAEFADPNKTGDFRLKGMAPMKK